MFPKDGTFLFALSPVGMQAAVALISVASALNSSRIVPSGSEPVNCKWMQDRQMCQGQKTLSCCRGADDGIGPDNIKVTCPGIQYGLLSLINPFVAET